MNDQYQGAPTPLNEAERLAALRRYGILDTPPEPAYDDIAKLVAHICGTPTSMVSLVDEDRQWFKARVNTPAAETSRDIAFCAHTILGRDVFVVGDAHADARFASNPQVTEAPRVRFYAGAPLVTTDDHALGALCAIDYVPRVLEDVQLGALTMLSRQVISQLELRRSHMLLAEEELLTERLLHAILPRPVAQRLKIGESPIADSFEDATVMFADLVGFTPRAARLSATATVEMLGSVFSEFDRLADRHGVEKIKTIGDAYLVVGGVPLRRHDHMEAVVEMALDMMEAMKRRADGLSLRIGIHAGPIVAGVLGCARLGYDVWGDTVNTASRMESHGVPGAIQVGEVIERRLRGGYRFEERGALLVKGKGEMNTFLLTGRR